MIIRLDRQREENKSRIMQKLISERILQGTARETIERESAQYSEMSLLEKARYRFERLVQRTLRESPTFQGMDNHHFMHHYRMRNNLNVVFPGADFLFKTKVDSSRATLEEPKYWICPNSPEEEKFRRK
jgi:hypothetical protein